MDVHYHDHYAAQSIDSHSPPMTWTQRLTVRADAAVKQDWIDAHPANVKTWLVGRSSTFIDILWGMAKDDAEV